MRHYSLLLFSAPTFIAAAAELSRVRAAPKLVRPNPVHAASITPANSYYPRPPQQEEEPSSPLEVLFSTCYGTATILYGTALLLFSRDFFKFTF